MTGGGAGWSSGSGCREGEQGRDHLLGEGGWKTAYQEHLRVQGEKKKVTNVT